MHVPMVNLGQISVGKENLFPYVGFQPLIDPPVRHCVPVFISSACVADEH